MAEWEVLLVAEVVTWYEKLLASDAASADQVEDAINVLAEAGSSRSSEIRILFAFDPVRRAVLLVAGDKWGDWRGWYETNIPLAEERYRSHLLELDTREYE